MDTIKLNTVAAALAGCLLLAACNDEKAYSADKQDTQQAPASAAAAAAGIAAPAAEAETAVAAAIARNPVTINGGIDALVAKTGLADNTLVKLTHFKYPGDGMGMQYVIKNSLYTSATYRNGEKASWNRVLTQIAVRMKNGQYAIPQNLRNIPDVSRAKNYSIRAEEFVRIAETYRNAGTRLKWNNQRMSPFNLQYGTWDNQPYWKRYPGQPGAVTCSSFVNMVLSGWEYGNTTFVSGKYANRYTVGNSTTQYPWAAQFNRRSPNGKWYGYLRPDGMRMPYEAHELLQWMYWSGYAGVNKVSDPNDPTKYLRRGDILFFSDYASGGSDGAGGKVRTNFMNVHHVAIYLGKTADGKDLIHSFSQDSAYGVDKTAFWNAYKYGYLTFVARPLK